MVGYISEICQPLDEPQRSLSLLAGVLKNACHACCLPCLSELLALAGIVHAARHHHALTGILDLYGRGVLRG